MKLTVFDEKSLKRGRPEEGENDDYFTIQVRIPRFKAVDMAGYYLQSVLERYGKPIEDFNWRKLGYMCSETDDISFRYKNQVFSILVLIYYQGEEIQGDERGEINEERKKRFIENCEKNNLIPCYFPMNTKFIEDADGINIDTEKTVEMTFDIPKETEWNLFDARDNSPINPIEMVTDETIMLSEYEQTLIAFYFIQTHLSEMNIKLKEIWNEHSPIMIGDDNGSPVAIVVKSISEEEFENIKQHNSVLVNIENKRLYDNLGMKQMFFGIKFEDLCRKSRGHYKYIHAPITKIESWSKSNTYRLSLWRYEYGLV